MRRLGYERYGAQGRYREHGFNGTWPDRAERIVGVHCNGLSVFPTGDPAESENLTAVETSL